MRKRQLAHNDLQIMSTNIETFERTVATQQPLSVEQIQKKYGTWEGLQKS